MAFSGILRRVDLVRTDVSDELSASIISVAKIGELGTTLGVTSNRSVCRSLVKFNVVPSSPILVTMMMEVLNSSETSVLLTASRHTIPEDTILHSHRHENLKSHNCRCVYVERPTTNPLLYMYIIIVLNFSMGSFESFISSYRFW
jgi:hypothetical protein